MPIDAALPGLDSLIQYGAIGMLLAYFLWLDHKERSRKNIREDLENKARVERDIASAKREEACVKSNAEIRRHQIEVLTPLLTTSNYLHKATLEFMKKKNLLSPLPENIPFEQNVINDDDEDEETKILRRNR